MFVVSEADAAAIRAVFDAEGAFAAAVELRRRFPGVMDNAHAAECARVIAGWKPIVLPRRVGRRRRESCLPQRPCRGLTGSPAALCYFSVPVRRTGRLRRTQHLGEAAQHPPPGGRDRRRVASATGLLLHLAASGIVGSVKQTVRVSGGVFF
jgi:hypothetical protein